MHDTQALRQALRESLPAVDHVGRDPDRPPAFTYVPPSHAKALDPEVTLVEGIRGSGKSFWWSHLSSAPHRHFIATAFPEIRFNGHVQVEQAFGAQVSSDHAPSQDVLAKLVKDYPPRAIWRTVLAQRAGFAAPYPAQGLWDERVGWVHHHPEEFDTLLQQVDRALDAKGITLVVLFDALDRLAEDWTHIRPLAKGLLQIALDLRTTRRLRFKIFLRPDILQDRDIVGFPDASKLLARRAALTWRRADLYALLFQCFGNAPQHGQAFRGLTEQHTGLPWQRAASAHAWLLPGPMRTDETLQESLFALLAGKAMAAGPSGFKRGKPYTWLVNHLLDSLDQVSPRSFFAAVRQAADETADDCPLAIDYRMISKGVQSASQIRVDEVTTEDYPWVELVMRPLRGRLTVPCAASDIESLWRDEHTLALLRDRLRSMGGTDVVKLPPQHLDEGATGVLTDLESLGLLKRLEDQRIQMPDVYRIAFGLGRRGGVKPLK